MGKCTGLDRKLSNAGGNAMLKGRRREVAWHLSQGASYAVVAKLLYLSPETVRGYAREIYERAGVSSRREYLNFFHADTLASNPTLRGLSQREAQVANCLAAGMTRSQTGTHLGLSSETVKSYARSIFNKLGVSSRDDLYLLTHSS
ncbi:helix-turn-helix transcriptional regulator [Adlercreutzia sp. R7]|uniref:Helix-turn-helix transcriptional regulator n=1 Tax=Adlercreutzia wanghongyangiae TaxID=3111451 RepID=A0ABU6IET8_9ACTN|nr:helix-turn-helix transcriptional regulator [Adlercreutzia sp. R7]